MANGNNPRQADMVHSWKVSYLQATVASEHDSVIQHMAGACMLQAGVAAIAKLS